VADWGNNRIQVFDSGGTYLTQWVTAVAGAQFANPTGVAVDGSGHVYVADGRSNCMQMYTSSGTDLTQWGSYGSGNGQFAYPIGVAVDSGGLVYVVDFYNNRIQVFGSLPTAATSTSWGRIKALYR
jgi:DNA-binding beta-propeller fold protein YncE